MRTVHAVVLFVGLLGCSGSGSGRDCDAIEKEIRDAAVKRRYDGNGDGTPDAIGICNDTNPTIKKDFGAACDELRTCN